jgi:anti-sigma regulatory factor (Ser/Thr protein kinase)
MQTQPPLRIPATAEGLRTAVAAFEGFCAAESLPRAIVWRLQVALDEVLSNIVHHGGGTRIEISFRREAEVAEITVRDDGAPFDPASWPAPDVTSSLEARQTGGLGIALVKSLIDEIDYRRDDRNVLTLRTRIAAARKGQEN